MGWHSGWAPYVPVAQRRRQGEAAAKKLLKKGQVLTPIRITTRQIATTFWGAGWCKHIEQYCDASNRLPRGRTYARNGSIVDLQITSGKVTALVSGSSLYKIAITISPLEKKHWAGICSGCATSIHSVIDLMRGKLSDRVIERLTDPGDGMFPRAKEIKLACSCPDGAYMCKHLAAVLYGVGSRLDHAPELLFVLRGVDQADLVAKSIGSESAGQSIGLDARSSIATADLGDIFGIELAPTATSGKPTKAPRKASVKKTTSAMTKPVTSRQKKATVAAPAVAKAPAKPRKGSAKPIAAPPVSKAQKRTRASRSIGEARKSKAAKSKEFRITL